ncbi:hypothetical protein AKJ57_04715 [candidate division MSBL1 archaeon SCGC-AAA259A05]|uniref:Zinc-ribbon domain-containing protein n=1 Tax=candidate division MSBL1 archaeon SCGC-AAA259A05 TaxID=1698259 RepID=A0A133U6U9_9EURY|nr:hypothetical protein AKJ57_04715 [candidate division MSBL1 archaeon SCGC-AAA259A05]
MKSLYHDIAKTSSILLLWTSLGWGLFPTLASKLSDLTEEPLDIPMIKALSYPLAIITLGLAAVLFWWWWTSTPLSSEEIEEKEKKKFYKCPYCGEEIGINETRCRHCNSKIPGTSPET